MRSIFTIHAGEYIVGSYIEEKFKDSGPTDALAPHCIGTVARLENSPDSNALERKPGPADPLPPYNLFVADPADGCNVVEGPLITNIETIQIADRAGKAYRAFGVEQACALVDLGFVRHRLRRGHQNRLDRVGGQARVFFQHQGNRPGNDRCRHAGAGHLKVLRIIP